MTNSICDTYWLCSSVKWLLNLIKHTSISPIESHWQQHTLISIFSINWTESLLHGQLSPIRSYYPFPWWIRSANVPYIAFHFILREKISSIREILINSVHCIVIASNQILLEIHHLHIAALYLFDPNKTNCRVPYIFLF